MPNLQPVPSFLHRISRDGSWVSVCMRCLEIAARTPEEYFLAAGETGHCCEDCWQFTSRVGVAMTSVWPVPLEKRN